MNHKTPSDTKTTRQNKNYAYWLAIAIAAILALVLFIVDLIFDFEPSSARTISAVGASLLGAAIFGVLVELLFNRETISHLKDWLCLLFDNHDESLLNMVRSVNRESESKRKAMLHSIIEEHLLDMVRLTCRRHVPSKEYPPTNEFDSAFMLDLMKDLSNSSKFWFRGSSGKWIAPYINYCMRNLNIRPITEIKAIILDPTDERALNQTVVDRERYDRQPRPELVAKLLKEIRMAIVSLYDVPGPSIIEIFLSGATASPVGIDLTDEAVYVGLQVTGRELAERIPWSYRYENDSLAYQNYHIELFRQSKIARATIKFDDNRKKAHLKDAFKTLEMKDISDNEIKELRQEAKEFEKIFFENMNDATRQSSR